MQQITYTQTASLTLNGITPSAGPGMVLLANPTLAASGTYNDYVAETFVVGANTPATEVEVGGSLMTTGKILWMQTDVPLGIILTQNAVDNPLTVSSFLLVNTDFTKLQVVNDSNTAVNVSLVVAGTRPAGSGPGVY